MNVAKGHRPQGVLQSCDQCLFLPEKVDVQMGVVPLIDLPQMFQDVVSDCPEKQSSQRSLQTRNETREINTRSILTSRLIEPPLSADQEDINLLHQVALRTDTALDAFTELYTRHHDKLRRFCHIFLKNPDRVEEVTQEVWLEVWTEAGTYKGAAKVTTWMFGRAKNHCYNKWRKEEQKEPYHFPIVSAEPEQMNSSGTEISASVIESRGANETGDPSVTVEVKVRRQLLWEAITTLSPLDRAILHLVYQEGKSLREVSQVLGKPEGTVKRRLSDARRTLRKELEKHEST